MSSAGPDYFSTESKKKTRRSSRYPSAISRKPSSRLEAVRDPSAISGKPSSRLEAVRGILAQNRDLLSNAGSLIGTTGVTSAFGFGYWIYAARFFVPQSVGYGTAAVSVMMLLSTIGISGFGTMLIGELPRRKSPGGLMMAGILASFILSIVLGLGFALVSLAYGTRFVEISGTFGRMTIFSLGVAVTSATFVFDDATIGLMRGGLQLGRNVAFSIAKIAILPVCALFLHDLFGVGIMLSWVLGTFISLVPVVIMIKRGGASILHRPDWSSLWELRKVILAHNWLNIAINTPSRLIPVIVVLVVAPSANAAFYIATMLASILSMIPNSLSTVLFAIASATPELISEKLRFVLRTALLIGGAGGLILALCSHLVLSVFGSSYVQLATWPLVILVVCYIPGLPNSVYIAVCRATGRVTQAAVFLTAAAAVEMAAIFVGGKIDGLFGLSIGILAVATLQALVTAPVVLRAAYGSARIYPVAGAATGGWPVAGAATGAWPVAAAATGGWPVAGAATGAWAVAAAATGAWPRLQPQTADDAMRARQEAGLAALLSMATTVDPGPQRPASRRGVRQLSSAVRATGAHLALTDTSSALTDTSSALTATTSWWPDVNEATFHDRQEVGMAALLAIAMRAARY
jgi:O-antigen/teichoic acid export membrane protein